MPRKKSDAPDEFDPHPDELGRPTVFECDDTIKFRAVFERERAGELRVFRVDMPSAKRPALWWVYVSYPELAQPELNVPGQGAEPGPFDQLPDWMR